MNENLVKAFEALNQEKGVSIEIIKEALEAALVSAYKKHYGTSQNVEIVLDETKGEYAVYQLKEVVEEVTDSQLEISLAEAKEMNRAYEPGDIIRFEVTPKQFGRIAAQTAKQVITQRLREAERNVIYNEYIEYEGELLNGTVERIDSRFVYVNIGKIEAVMSVRDQMPGEEYHIHDRIKVYVSKVEDSMRGPQIFVSRTNPGLIKRLFEQEVPEIYEGIVEIVSIAREAGDRSKLAVTAHDANVDPVGTCVGPRGARVQQIVNELHGENIDIVQWDKDPAIFIKNALNPAEVLAVTFDEHEERVCTVVVPDNQLSLAIGRRGQNVRLAAKLTDYKIDIQPLSESDVVIEEMSADTSEEISPFFEALADFDFGEEDQEEPKDFFETIQDKTDDELEE
ncbi:transcription termination factor NusA [Allofustis seminis]|uniref:transcription termination factor NusA n=1 Tax=Allofustis seminis TaxID=166939 RepID=UPI0003612383|nr:transcription termination factor NusA [Allofustis seminis]